MSFYLIFHFQSTFSQLDALYAILPSQHLHITAFDGGNDDHAATKTNPNAIQFQTRGTQFQPNGKRDSSAIIHNDYDARGDRLTPKTAKRPVREANQGIDHLEHADS